MGVELGSIDDRRRPVVRVELENGHSVLALLDTGFNGDFYMTAAVAASLDITTKERRDTVNLAGGVEVAIRVGRIRARWLHDIRTFEVFIADDPTEGRPLRDGDPVALAGTGLLYPHLIMLDFAADCRDRSERSLIS